MARTLPRWRTILPGVLTVAISVALTPGARAEDPSQLLRLLDSRRCAGCHLQDADLAQADLRDADLRHTQLQRANLSGARLDGANLAGANLAMTSLGGASLRGANLRGARLEGTDLRQADLSGAQLDPGSLSQSHWDQAKGIAAPQLSYAELHNAGVGAAAGGRYPEAEQFFGEAIRRQPQAAISWVARGISRSEQGKISLGAQDLRYAASLYKGMGDVDQAKELEQASNKLEEAPKKGEKGNGFGSALVGGAMAAFQFLAPIAAKALIPAAGL